MHAVIVIRTLVQTFILCTNVQKRAERLVKQLDKCIKDVSKLLPPSKVASYNNTYSVCILFTPNYLIVQIKVERQYSQDIKGLAVQLKGPINYTDQNQIGSGSDGSVFAVELNGSKCIAKRLHDILMGRGKQENVQLQEKQACHEKFCRECVLTSEVKHENVVKFLGVHFGKDQFDVTLFMERLHTDLYNYLNRTPDIPLPTKVSILHDVSCGLLYLHEKCSIIHRDLTAANILLTVDNRAKIADLGVSRIYHRTFSHLSKLPGTLPYMPPESFKDVSHYDESLDVFSFGVLTLSVGIKKSPDLSWDHVPDAVHTDGKGEIFKRQKWIDMLEIEQRELSPLVLWCLCDDPIHRPTTYCVNIMLQEMKNDLQTIGQ